MEVAHAVIEGIMALRSFARSEMHLCSGQERLRKGGFHFNLRQGMRYSFLPDKRPDPSNAQPDLDLL